MWNVEIEHHDLCITQGIGTDCNHSFHQLNFYHFVKVHYDYLTEQKFCENEKFLLKVVISHLIINYL